MTNLPFTGLFRINQTLSKNHPGLDIKGLSNTNVYCVCDGVVRSIKYLQDSYGTHVTVTDSATNKIFIFAHLASVTKNLKVGDHVTRTSVIGVMGSTGNSTGPHLHLELRDSNYTYSTAHLQGLVEYLGIPNQLGTYNSADYQISTLNMTYNAHCQNYGWHGEKKNGEMAGAFGEGLRIEAVIINADINIQYRVHMEGIGWGPWVPNGCMAGTTGESRRVEAIEIQSSSATMLGQGYVENIGYQSEVRGTQIVIGTTGQGLRLEGFRLKFV